MKNVKFLYLFILIFSFNYFFSQEKSKTIEKINGKEYYVHNVKKGESLYGISKIYGIDIQDILNENPAIKDKGLRTGTTLLIPLKVEKLNNNDNKIVRDTLQYNYHLVKKGETVFSICKWYKITQDEFYNFNPDAKNGIKENDWVIVGKKEIPRNKIPIQSIVNEVKEVSQLLNNSISDKFEKKNKYIILALLPFGNKKVEELVLEDLVKTDQNFPLMSSMMVDFFKGLESAVDSMKTDSFDVQIIPIDITENDSTKLIQLCREKIYKDADVIIGPVFSSMIKLEQNISNENKFHIIPFVSNNKFLFNHPEYSKTTPSVYVDIEVLAKYVFDSLRTNSKVVLLASGLNDEKEYSKSFRKNYNELIYKNNLKDTIVTYKNLQEFKSKVKDKENYTVVFLTNNQVLATDYITQLSIIHKTSPIRLCGFYKTVTFDNLDLEYLNMMNYTFAYYQNLNYRNLYSNWIKKYKDEFNTDPSIFYYEGFQIGLYYFDGLKKNGLNCLIKLDNYECKNNNQLFMKFKFYRPDENTGFQNNGEFLFKVLDRKLVKID
ncbi:MAG TPA: LysM peptidoglycan-binding domain-containing protein [Bacteroidia bacterium]|nr:LysM peptidoglycan-binding domain-containing protein [Bacteroidia bacterium]